MLFWLHDDGSARETRLFALGKVACALFIALIDALHAYIMCVYRAHHVGGQRRGDGGREGRDRGDRDRGGRERGGRERGVKRQSTLVDKEPDEVGAFFFFFLFCLTGTSDEVQFLVSTVMHESTLFALELEKYPPRVYSRV